jgi:DNA repair protein RecN (Recombination protein N)
MLETIRIKNIAIIDEATIQFRQGLNIISGETGAGKSIIIDSISLLLGARNQVDLIRTGCDEAMVEGVFDITHCPQVIQQLEAHHLVSSSPSTPELLIIRRLMNRKGKHRILVNDSPVTLTTLQSITEDLVDLCGQHEHQSLLKSKTQMSLIDQFGGLTSVADQFRHHFIELVTLKDELTHITQQLLEKDRKIDYLHFQLQELSRADLQPQEDVALSAEKTQLQTTDQRSKIVHSMIETIEEERVGILSSLKQLIQKSSQLSHFESDAEQTQLQNFSDSLTTCISQVEDFDLYLNRYSQHIDQNPHRLEEVIERLSMIADLRRKYGTTIEAILEHQAQLQLEYDQLTQSDEVIEKLKFKISEKESVLKKLATSLSRDRKKAAVTFSKAVTQELKDLRMSDSLFTVQLQDCPTSNEWSLDGGPNTIEFDVITNQGEESKALQKIVSGGELSRLMLSVRRVISEVSEAQGGIGVYLFDEIDAGIGGQTAFQVGKKLKSVAEHHQVICITHLPQVASFGDHHLSVRKEKINQRTVTEIKDLNPQERKEEIARMLGGPKLTQKSIDNASELIESTRN